MVDVAQYINEVKRDSEHMDIIQKVRVSFEFPFQCNSALQVAVAHQYNYE